MTSPVNCSVRIPHLRVSFHPFLFLIMIQDNEQIYSRMMELLLDALKVEDPAKNKVFQVLKGTDSFKAKKGTSMVSPEEESVLHEIKNETNTFLTNQQRGLACLHIQRCWRRHVDIKKFRLCQKVYVKGRNTRVHDMLQREVGYTTLITQLAQRYAVPISNTLDRALKEESNDIREILGAIIDIERLHRFVWFY